MRKKILAMAAVAVVSTSLAVARPASADVTLSSASLSVPVVVLDGDAGCGSRSTVSVRVSQPSSDAYVDYTSVLADVVGPLGDSADYLVLPKVGRSGDVVTFRGAVSLCGWSATPGRYEVRVSVSWFENSGSLRESTQRLVLYVKRPTGLSYNASPEPVARGGLLTHAGRLLFDLYAPGAKYGPAGVTLKVAFRRAGSTVWVQKATMTTKKNGFFAGTLRADVDGTWRVSYPNNSFRQTQEKTDYVDVR